jgi:uncharacterized membrane protein YhiD involved in acid resistance
MLDLHFDFSVLLTFFVKVLLTYALTLPIGRERKHDDHSAGLRTFPQAATATSGYIVLASQVLIELAVVIGLVTFFTLRLFTRIEQQRQPRQASSPPER